MNDGTYKAVKAILEADSSLSDSQRAGVLAVCRNPEAIEPTHANSRPEFVTAKEAAEILKTSKRTIWRLVKIGKIQRIKLGHRCTRFRLEDIANITSMP